VNRQIQIDRVAGVFSVDRLLAADPGDAHGRRLCARRLLDDPLPTAGRMYREHRLCLDRDWRGVPAPVMVHALLVLDDACLHLAAWLHGPAWVFADAVPGRYRRGLWQRDVVELFLCDREGDGYREYHLSPGGEWWMGCFSAPRIPALGDGALDDEAVVGRGVQVRMPSREASVRGSGDAVERGGQVFGGPGGGGWRGALSLPRELLPPGFVDICERAAVCRANLAAVIGCDPRRFLSLVPLPGNRPDFHQPELFPHLTVEPFRIH
jgi:hypothetical protein